MLAVYVLFGPQSNRCGILRLSIGMAAEDLNLSIETLAKRLPDVATTFGWKWDETDRVIFIPSWWRWNPPENPKVLLGCLNDLAEVPAGPLLTEFSGNTQYLSTNLHETFRQTLSKRFGNMSDISISISISNSIPPRKKNAGRINATTKKNPAVDYVEGAIGSLCRR
jgi:hypothetical protein